MVSLPLLCTILHRRCQLCIVLLNKSCPVRINFSTGLQENAASEDVQIQAKPVLAVTKVLRCSAVVRVSEDGNRIVFPWPAYH
jgi:hypothetical protein